MIKFYAFYIKNFFQGLNCFFYRPLQTLKSVIQSSETKLLAAFHVRRTYCFHGISDPKINTQIKKDGIKTNYDIVLIYKLLSSACLKKKPDSSC
jgi:hypothetical protein